MTFLEIISTIKDIILAVSAITAAIIAVKGLNTWQHKLKGQTDYELSRRILVTLFKYRDVINGVRHPAIYHYELPSPPEEETKKMNHSQIRYYGTSKAYHARWEKVQNEKTSLYADILESEAIWGIELKNLFKDLYTLENELFSQLQNHLELTDPDINEGDKVHLYEIKNKKRNIMYDNLSSDDEFKNDMAAEIEKIEKYLQPKLSHDKV